MSPEPGFTVTLGITTEFRHYSVTEDELRRLASGASSLWKDFFLLTLSTCVSIAVAAYSLPSSTEIARQRDMLWMVTGTAALLTLFFGLGWWRSHDSIAALVTSIEGKERITLPPGTQFPAAP